MDSRRLLHEYTGHTSVYLLRRGNQAIMAALKAAQAAGKKKILVPDQGGWLTYLSFPKKLGLDVVQVKTDAGLLDLDSLNKHANEESCLLYQSPAGYFAHQDIEAIYRACKGLVIMDVSGCLGDRELCNGAFADMIVGSFGQWKAVDAGYGGFISSNDALNVPEDFDESYADDVYAKLASVKDRLDGLYKKCAAVKKDLSAYSIVHPDRKGIVVVVKFNNEKEFGELKAYCEGRELQYTVCPRYIRVNDNAISIEVKR